MHDRRKHLSTIENELVHKEKYVKVYTYRVANKFFILIFRKTNWKKNNNQNYKTDKTFVQSIRLYRTKTNLESGGTRNTRNLLDATKRIDLSAPLGRIYN